MQRSLHIEIVAINPIPLQRILMKMHQTNHFLPMIDFCVAPNDRIDEVVRATNTPSSPLPSFYQKWFLQIRINPSRQDLCSRPGVPCLHNFDGTPSHDSPNRYLDLAFFIFQERFQPSSTGLGQDHPGKTLHDRYCMVLLVLRGHAFHKNTTRVDTQLARQATNWQRPVPPSQTTV